MQVTIHTVNKRSRFGINHLKCLEPLVFVFASNLNASSINAHAYITCVCSCVAGVNQA